MKSLPIYVLSGALIFFGISSGGVASGTTSTDSRVTKLENQVRLLNTLRDLDAKQIFKLQNCILSGISPVINNGNSSFVSTYLPLSQCGKL